MLEDTVAAGSPVDPSAAVTQIDGIVSAHHVDHFRLVKISPGATEVVHFIIFIVLLDAVNAPITIEELNSPAVG